jgi:alpha-glucosidase
VKRVTVDGMEVKDYYTDDQSCLRFKSNKNFSEIHIQG